MEYRIARPEDYPVLCQLWQDVFGDSQEFALTALKNFIGPEGIYVAADENGPVAQLGAAPVTLQGRRGAYFYALATRPDCRGRGLMHGLIEYACQQLLLSGHSFACLIPAGPSLFDFYAEQGFVKAFPLREFTVPIRHNLWAQAEFDTVTAKALLQLREQFVPNSLTFDLQRISELLRDLYTGGVTTVTTPEGYGLYFVKGETLRFIELFAKSDRDAENLLEAAREKERAEEAQITLGAAQSLFMGAGEEKDYGMIRFLAQPFDVSESYMRLMLDEV